MPPTSPLRWLAGAATATMMLASCGIRLPDPPAASPASVSVSATATPRRPDRGPGAPADPHVLVWLTADTYHTGMIFPYDWLLESGYIPPAGFGHPRHVAMSWGNQDAYSPEGFDTPWKFVRVLFTPTPSVMEIIPMNWNIAEMCPDQRIWRKLVRRDRGPALAAFLNHCATPGPDGRPVQVRPSSWGAGTQLRGRHSYYLPRICNVWTAQTIERLGGRVQPWLALTADGLARQAVRPPNDFELIWAGFGRQPSTVNP